MTTTYQFDSLWHLIVLDRLKEIKLTHFCIDLIAGVLEWKQMTRSFQQVD